MLSKCLLDGTDHMEALLEIRNTPQQEICTSPAQRMFSRRCRTMVPTPTALLQSRVTQADNQQVKSQKRKQVRSYNRYKARARPLDTGSSVMMKPFNTGGKRGGEAVYYKDSTRDHTSYRPHRVQFGEPENTYAKYPIKHLK